MINLFISLNSLFLKLGLWNLKPYENLLIFFRFAPKVLDLLHF